MDRWREVLVGLGASIVGGLIVLALGAAPPVAKRPLIADVQELRLVGSDGRVQASLHANEEGTASMSFYDRQGQPRLILSIEPDGTAAVMLGDQASKDKASLMVLPSGTVGLSLQTRARGSIIMGIPHDQKPNLEMSDAARRPLFQAVK